MSRKPENQFRVSVHGYFKDRLHLIHHEKMSNPYRAGGADDWYSGKRASKKTKTCDLWIEWKFIVVPVRDDTVIDLTAGKKPPLTELQQLWLRERYEEGRNVWVGVGSAKGGVILTDLAWEKPMTAAAFRTKMVPRQELAEVILRFVQGSK